MSVQISVEELQELMEENGGLCAACGARAYGIEPDAREYECEECGAHKVYGAEEALLMGLAM